LKHSGAIISIPKEREVPAMLRYYDQVTRRHHLKPRYKWAAWAFAAGLVFGMVMAWLL
jgi:hypothetical protein